MNYLKKNILKIGLFKKNIKNHDYLKQIIQNRIILTKNYLNDLKKLNRKKLTIAYK